MKVRVCHILSGDLWAGAEAMGYSLIKGLSQSSEVSVVAVVLNPGVLHDRLRDSGVEVHLIDETKNSLFEIARKVSQVLEGFPADVIHAHRYKENLVAFLTIWFFRVRAFLVTTLHGLPERPRGAGIRESVKSSIDSALLGHYFHAVVAVSEDIRQTLKRARVVSAGRIEVIRNGIVTRNGSGSTDERTTVLISSAGRLFPVKDYELMVEVAKEVALREPSARFALAGDGPMFAQIRSLVDRYELGRVFELRGFSDDLTPFFAESDIFLNTSRHEGIPISVLEAMSAQLPIVAPAVGGIPEIVRHGIDGYLVFDRSPSKFADRCVELVRCREMRHRMGQSAAARVKSAFSTERMVSDYLNFYHRVIREIDTEGRLQRAIRIAKRWVSGLWCTYYCLGVGNPPFPEKTRKITFVCKGNICRSVFAHRLAKNWLFDRAIEEIEVDSGGLEVGAANAPPENARIAARRFGVSVDDSRSKQVEVEDSGPQDIFVVMEPNQLRRLRDAYPDRHDQFFLLPLFLDSKGWSALAPERSCVHDPYGKGLKAFYSCFTHIESCLEAMFKNLGFNRQGNGSTG